MCEILENKRRSRKAGIPKTVSASKPIFFANTAKNRYGRRQPCHSDFSCLCIKIFTFEVLRSFAAWIFACNKERYEEILGVFQKVIPKLRGKRLQQNRILSYEIPPETAVVFCVDKLIFKGSNVIIFYTVFC